MMGETKKSPRVLLVIPAYNEAENIERVVDDLIAHYPQYDYLVVNDGSRDATPEICRRKHYNYLDMPINVGLSDAVQAGLMYAYAHGYDYAVQFDGDGQHDPACIEAMMEAMKECDICIGSRFVEHKKPHSLRMIGSRLIGGVLLLTVHRKIKDPTSGMRMYNRRVMKVMSEQTDYGPEPDTIAHLIRSGANVREVQAEMRERIAGESYLKPWRALRYMTHMCFSILFIQWFRKKVRLKGDRT